MYVIDVFLSMVYVYICMLLDVVDLSLNKKVIVHRNSWVGTRSLRLLSENL